MSFVIKAEGHSALMEPPRGQRKPGRIVAGSEQQEAFWSELTHGSGHVLLEARAGTGKSSSCREGMYRLLESDPGLAIRYCCFNKKIADEFGAACPPQAESGTMHRFGHMALQSAFGSRLEKDKTYTLLDQAEGGASLKRYVRKSIATLVSLAKNHGLRPDVPDLDARLAEFVVFYDVETWGRLREVIRWASEILTRSAETTSVIDFDDMLWMAVLYGVRFPGVDFLFIDECQDLNPVQHEMAELLSGSGRTVIVGDPFQAIYGWRGAATDSIPRLRDRLGAKTLPLTVTWRCPRSHVELARDLVPDFEAAPGAKDGVLTRGDKALIDHARPGDMVLCRANAPIVQACLHQVARRVPAVVRGRAIGDQLLAVVKKAEGGSRTIPEFVRALAVWRAKEIGRLEAKDGTEDLVEQVTDKCMCLDAIASGCSSPAEIPGVIDDLFADDDSATRVTFSSVHRAKGSEAENVTYLQIPYSEKRDKVRSPQPWELQQRKNLRYVALTRSLDTLTLIS